MKRGIRIEPEDHVIVVLEDVESGDEVTWAEKDGTHCQAKAGERIPMYHKMAVREIRAGEPVLKYGEPIGRAREAIHVGRHVHVQNVGSVLHGL